MGREPCRWNRLLPESLRQGQRDYREKMNAGQSPFLPVLDDILQNVPVENQIPLGQVEIPLELLVGTKTSGRTAAFCVQLLCRCSVSRPSLPPSGSTCACPMWMRASVTPSPAMSTWAGFYVQEGNKRVSVLKYF